MALGNYEQSRVWLSINHGKVEQTKDGEKRTFSYVEGTLSDIHTIRRTYGSEVVEKWQIDLSDEGGELYSITFPYNSGTFKSIILALASDEYISPDSVIRIEPYQKGNFTNVVVWSEGVKLDWVTKELPPVRKLVIAGRQVTDDSERMSLITDLVNLIKNRIEHNK